MVGRQTGIKTKAFFQPCSKQKKCSNIYIISRTVNRSSVGRPVAKQKHCNMGTNMDPSSAQKEKSLNGIQLQHRRSQYGHNRDPYGGQNKTQNELRRNPYEHSIMVHNRPKKRKHNMEPKRTRIKRHIETNVAPREININPQKDNRSPIMYPYRPILVAIMNSMRHRNRPQYEQLPFPIMHME